MKKATYWLSIFGLAACLSACDNPNKATITTCDDISGDWLVRSEFTRCDNFKVAMQSTDRILQKQCTLLVESSGYRFNAGIAGNEVSFPGNKTTVFDNGTLERHAFKLKVEDEKFTGSYTWFWQNADESQYCNGITHFSGERRLNKATDPEASTAIAAIDTEEFDIHELEKARKFAESSLNLSSVLVMKDDKIVLEKYGNGFGPGSLHQAFSVTKSVTSTLIGIALDKGLIPSVDATLKELMPTYFSEGKLADKANITLKQLLTMTSGLSWREDFTDPQSDYWRWYNAPDQVEALLKQPFDSTAIPGRYFHYNTAASHLLSVVIREASGMSTIEFADKHLFRPLGINSYAYGKTPAGDFTGGQLMELSTRDMAKLGQLFLHKGNWNGQQIVSQAWTEEATRRQVRNHHLGYGYQWWRTRLGKYEGYQAFGYGGQSITVLPALQTTIVTTHHTSKQSQNIPYLLNLLASAIKQDA